MHPLSLLFPLDPPARSDSTLTYLNMGGPRCTSLETLSPASPRFVDDALEFVSGDGSGFCLGRARADGSNCSADHTRARAARFPAACN
jgi:hypothetical protein